MESPLSCGLEVSSKTLVVSLATAQGTVRRREVSNTPAGHRELVQWLSGPSRRVRVCLEATGVYGLDIALALEAADGIEVMVANPRAARRFADAMMQRAKTDRIDADMLRQFAERMPFVAFQPPAESALALRAITRRLQALTHQRTGEKNRLHAAESSTTTPQVIVQSLKRQIRALDREIERLEQQAQRLIEADPLLERRHQLLQTLPGVGPKSAPKLLAELSVLPQDLTPRQWVAHAGLDPRPVESGLSVRKPRRISKTGNRRLRAALYMPALTAAHWNPPLRAFYEQLKRRGLCPMQALVAVMRKLLHAIHGIWTNNQPFNPQRLLPNMNTRP